MVCFKIMPGKYRGVNSIRNVLRYILNEKKNPHGVHNVCSTSHEDIEKFVYRFVKVQEINRNTCGKRVIHFILSFEMDCPYTPNEYRAIGNKVVQYYKGHQVIFALHEKDNDDEIKQPHIHFAMNPISYITGKRIHIGIKEIRNFYDYLDTIFPNVKIHLLK